MKSSKLISTFLFVAASGYAAIASSAASPVLTPGGVVVNTVNNTASQKVTVTAIGTAGTRSSRTGFVKNDFEVTISATVEIVAADTNTAFGVGAGSSKGRAVFTGHSDGGSVTQCGDLAASSSDGATLLTTSTLDMAKRDACTSNTSS